MRRDLLLKRLEDTNKVWDFIVIGGGATGVGVALDAASRGYNCLLVEQSDFGKGTSSRSTKLIHGGVRYLQQGNISLVKEALKERAILRKNAPHLVHDLQFIVPVYEWWEGPFYGIGLKMYDLLAGKEGFGSSELLSKEETIDLIPNVEQNKLIGGVKYFDGQFNDARLLINLVSTANEQGATMVNYMKLDSLISEKNKICGVNLTDQESKKIFNIKCKNVVNATGVFSDSIRKMANINVKPIMTSSQGIHLVFDKKFLPKETAIMIPTTDDGRVLFVVPWLDKIIVGTTDTFVDEYLLEPKALQEEIDYIIEHIARYLTLDPTKEDIKSVFVGLRPLVKNSNSENTAEISREHVINISDNGLISIAGGKWTTYRKMAEDTVDEALKHCDLPVQESTTENLQIHGYRVHSGNLEKLKDYGTDAIHIKNMYVEDSKNQIQLHENIALTRGEVLWMIRNEFARTVDDILSRRTRHLFLDAKNTVLVAPKVAEILAEELGYDNEWINNELTNFSLIANNYLLQ